MAETGEGPFSGEKPSGSIWDMSPEAEKTDAEEAEKKERERLMAEINKSFGIDIINVGTKIGLKIENTQDLKKIESNGDLQKLADALKAEREAAEKVATAAAEETTGAEEPTEVKDGAAEETEKSDESGKDVAGGVIIVDTMKDASEKYASDKAEGEPEATEGSETKEAEAEKTEKNKKRGGGLVGFFGRHPWLKRAAVFASLAALSAGMFAGGAKWQENRMSETPVGVNENGGFDNGGEVLSDYEMIDGNVVAYEDDYLNHESDGKNKNKVNPERDVTSPERFGDIETDDHDGWVEAYNEAYGRQPQAGIAVFLDIPEEVRSRFGITEDNYDELCERLIEGDSNGDYDTIHDIVMEDAASSEWSRFVYEGEENGDGKLKVLALQGYAEDGDYHAKDIHGRFDEVDAKGKTIIVQAVKDKDGDVMYEHYYLEYCGNLIVEEVKGITPVEETGDPTPAVTPEKPAPEPEKPTPEPVIPPTLEPKDVEKAREIISEDDHTTDLGPGEVTDGEEHAHPGTFDGGHFDETPDPLTGDKDGDGVADGESSLVGEMDTNKESADGSGRKVKEIVEAQTERTDSGVNDEDTTIDTSGGVVTDGAQGLPEKTPEEIEAERQAAAEAAAKKEADAERHDEQVETNNEYASDPVVEGAKKEADAEHQEITDNGGTLTDETKEAIREEAENLWNSGQFEKPGEGGDNGGSNGGTGETGGETGGEGGGGE